MNNGFKLEIVNPEKSFLSKEFVDNLNKDTHDKLENKNITDHERYILNHKLDVLKDVRV